MEQTLEKTDEVTTSVPPKMQHYFTKGAVARHEDFGDPLIALCGVEKISPIKNSDTGRLIDKVNICPECLELHLGE